MSNPLHGYVLDHDLIGEFDYTHLKHYGVLPLKRSDLYTLIAVSKQSDVSSFEQMYHRVFKSLVCLERDVMFYLCDLDKRLDLLHCVAQLLHSSSDQRYMERLILGLLSFAHLKGSSDIHLESSEDALIVKYRIDGILEQFFRFDYALYPMVSSVIKVWCQLDITQRRMPLNGRFSKKLDEVLYDFRVSIMPTILGESIVIRILNRNSVHRELSDLGLDRSISGTLREKLSCAQGMILVTGPTGSGKTTTLYALLSILSGQQKKVITIEDPVEYQIPHIQQVAVHNEIGLTFHEILKNVLRQDPDVIMIGEIRDKVSLDIALQASLTGHLVLATLHTNDSVSTINRLLDLNAEPFLLASTLKTILSQRLVLKLCQTCKHKVGDRWESKGCDACSFLGYKDRELIGELFVVDDQISAMIAKEEPLGEITAYARNKGFKPLLEQGQHKVQEGLIDQKELYRVVYH